MSKEDLHLNIILTLLEDYFPEEIVWVVGKNTIGQLDSVKKLEFLIIGDNQIKSDRMKYAKIGFKESELPYDIDLIDALRIDEDSKRNILEDYSIIKT